MGGPFMGAGFALSLTQNFLFIHYISVTNNYWYATTSMIFYLIYGPLLALLGSLPALLGLLPNNIRETSKLGIYSLILGIFGGGIIGLVQWIVLGQKSDFLWWIVASSVGLSITTYCNTKYILCGAVFGLFIYNIMTGLTVVWILG
jgi:hypothetical protein